MNNVINLIHKRLGEISILKEICNLKQNKYLEGVLDAITEEEKKLFEILKELRKLEDEIQ